MLGSSTHSVRSHCGACQAEDPILEHECRFLYKVMHAQLLSALHARAFTPGCTARPGEEKTVRFAILLKLALVLLFDNCNRQKRSAKIA